MAAYGIEPEDDDEIEAPVVAIEADGELSDDMEEAGSPSIAFDEPVEGEDELFIYDEDEPNLMEAFANHPVGRDYLDQIRDRVIHEFDSAWESTEEYRARFRDDWKIFCGDLPPKNYPWENAANTHVPIMLENLSRLSARSAGELFGDWTNVFGVLPMGSTPAEELEASILSKHGNWQLRHQILDFRRQMHRAVLLFFTAGDVTCHSWYDPATFKNRHEVLTVDEFVIPYTLVTTMPDYSDVPFKCKILYRYKHEIQRMRGVWYDVDRVLDREPPSWDSEPEAEFAQSVAEVAGIEIPDDTDYVPYKLIWYEGWLPMPNNEADRYCKVVIDYDTQAIMQLAIHEQPDWQDQDRFERQVAERTSYFAARASYENTIAQAKDQQATVSQLRQEQGVEVAEPTQQLPTEPPPPPDWMKDPDNPDEEPERPRKVPIQMFSHGVCIESLRGNLGLSFGRIQADFNRAANTSLSQFTDAAHLANSWSLITTDVGFEDPFEISPGRVNKATGISGQELRNAIYELKPDPANAQLLQIVDKMYDYGQSSVQAPSVLSGESGKSGETYRGISARIEQATKQLSVATRKFADFFEQILKCNAALNAEHLPDREIIMINDHELQRPEPVQISRTMYERDYLVEIRSDLRFAAQAQKIAEADEILQLPGVSPALQGNFAFQYDALVDSLRARGKFNLVDDLGEKPPPPPVFGPPMPPPGMGGEESAEAGGPAPGAIPTGSAGPAEKPPQ
jgi:hypothetical protein